MLCSVHDEVAPIYVCAAVHEKVCVEYMHVFVPMSKRNRVGGRVRGGSARAPESHDDSAIVDSVATAVVDVVSSGVVVSDGVRVDAPAVDAVVQPDGAAESQPVADVAATDSPARVHAAHVPGSPGNREKFLAGLHVQQVGCNLEGVNVGPATKLTFRGTVVVVYPPSANPDRRYVLFMDANGSVGITVWHTNVPRFGPAAIGRAVIMTKMMVTVHAGKRSLTMSKDSMVNFVEGENPWWAGLQLMPSLSISDVFLVPENGIINVSGIVGSITVEEKSVRAESRELLIIRLVDRTGQIELRSWHSKLSDFSRFREKPVLFQRVRVTAYAGSKMCELIEGTGTVMQEQFDGAHNLAQFWKE